MGSRTFEDLLALVATLQAAEQRKQACDIKFYGAQFLLETGNRLEAQQFWRQAEHDCPLGTMEQNAAHAELKRLGD